MFHRNRFIALFVGGAAVIASAIAFPASASETSERDLVNELIRQNPGSTQEMILDSADEIAQEMGASREEVLRRFIEAEQENARLREQTLSENRQAESRSTDASARTLPTAYYKGDMYLTPSYTAAVINHGHIGIYGDKDWVIEASGPKWNSGWWWHYQIPVAKGTVLMETTLTQAQQNSAADYAYRSLIGYPYNYKFWSNKEQNPTRLNCSQLVWLAYMRTSGVDLDGNGGPGVYPYDIKASPYTKVNWTVE